MTIVSTGSLTLKDLNDAKSLTMYIGGSQSSQVIFDGNSGYTPDYSASGTNQVLTPQLRIAGGSDVSSSASATRWYYQTNGVGTPTQITASGSGYTLGGTQPITLTISSNVLASNTAMNYICEMDYTDTDTGFLITTKADFQVAKITNGTNSFLATLSNESSTFGADLSGNVSSYAGGNVDIQVFDGQTALTYDGTGTAKGTFKVVATATSITAGALSGSGTTKASYAVPSAMSADSANISFAITGTSKTGVAISITKVQNFSRSKTGSTGASATTYWLVTPASVGKSNAGVYAQTSVTINAYNQVGTGAPALYNGFIMIQTSVNGSFSDAVTAVANTTQLASGAYTWTITAGIKAFKVFLYTATGGSGNVDTQTSYIVQDGINTVYNHTWTPNGNAIQNNNGSVVVEADIFDGSQQVASATPTYKWYLQDPSATTASGGDVDGGNGWRLMSTIATPTAGLTLTAPTVAGATLPVGTYYIKYTWVNQLGETLPYATEQTQATTAVGQALNIVIPAFPTGVIGANVYVSSATGTESFQGQISASAGSLQIKAPLLTGQGSVPTVNSTTATGYQITVPANTVNGMEAFKCVATYSSNKYTGVATVQDLSDPIAVVITGIDTFKNGVGTTSLTAKCYQSGAEVDASGTLYTYSWSMYDQNNVLITTTYSALTTGKTVTVDGRDFVARASIICSVNK